MRQYLGPGHLEPYIWSIRLDILYLSIDSLLRRLTIQCCKDPDQSVTQVALLYNVCFDPLFGLILGRGTEISTLPGGENLGQIDDIVYFQKRLYRSLNVPLNRLEQEAQFSLGRSTEIGRDEVKFQKFVDRLRKRFSNVFLNIIRKQLLLKGVITEQDWDMWKNDIVIDFVRDNHFTELTDAELLRERLQTMDQISQYVGEYFSREWVMKNVMMMSDEDIDLMKKEVEAENSKGGDEDEGDFE